MKQKLRYIALIVMLLVCCLLIACGQTIPPSDSSVSSIISFASNGSSSTQVESSLSDNLSSRQKDGDFQQSQSEISKPPNPQWLGQEDPTLDMAMHWKHIEVRNWQDVTNFVEHSYVLSERDGGGYIYFMAPADWVMEGSVFTWDGDFADGNLKLGEFFNFGTIDSNWSIVTKSNEVFPLQISCTVDGTLDLYAVDDPRLQFVKDDQIIEFHLKESEKYIRIISFSRNMLAQYVVKLDNGYCVALNFRISKALTSEEVWIYDYIVNSMYYVAE